MIVIHVSKCEFDLLLEQKVSDSEIENTQECKLKVDKYPHANDPDESEDEGELTFL